LNLKFLAFISVSLLLFCGCASQAQDGRQQAPSQESAALQSAEGTPATSSPPGGALFNAGCEATYAQKGVPECDGKESENMKELCYTKRRQGCYYSMILDAGDPELCERMPSAYPGEDAVLSTTYCYEYYWLTKNDSNICGTLESQSNRIICFMDFGMCESMQKEADSLSGTDLEFVSPSILSCYKIRKAKQEAISKAK